MSFSAMGAWLVDPEPILSLYTALAAVTGISNVWLAVIATDYFHPDSILNLFMQTWSLAVEAQFYLLFPFLVWFSRFGRAADGTRRFAVGLLLASILSLLAWSVVAGRTGLPSYFLTFPRFLELAAGCATALPSSRIRPGTSLALMTLIAAFLLPASHAWVALAGAVGSVMVLLATRAPANGILAQRGMVAIGRASYSLYLWHWPIIGLSALTFGERPWLWLLELAAAGCAGAASHALIETPSRAWLARRTGSFTLGATVLSLSGLAIVLLVMIRVPNTRPLAAWHFDQLPAAFPAFPVSGADHQKECAVDGLSRRLKATTMERCTAPPGLPGMPIIWAMGDSHAGHLLGMLATLRSRWGYGIHLVETPGNAFPPEPGHPFPERDRLWAETRPRLKDGDIILLGRLFLTRDGDIAPLPGLAAWAAEAAALADQMAPRHVRVVIVAPSPIFRFIAVTGCWDAPGWPSRCDVPRASEEAAVSAVETILDKARVGRSNLQIFRPFPLLCPPPSAVCSPVAERVPLYRDKDHLNAWGAGKLAPSFRDVIEAPEPTAR
jgi:peptidoglycan/LPS O-acetylase OafA/YrhL